MNYRNIVKLMEVGDVTLEEAKSLDSKGMNANSVEFDAWLDYNNNPSSSLDMREQYQDDVEGISLILNGY